MSIPDRYYQSVPTATVSRFIHSCATVTLRIRRQPSLLKTEQGVRYAGPFPRTFVVRRSRVRAALLDNPLDREVAQCRRPPRPHPITPPLHRTSEGVSDTDLAFDIRFGFLVGTPLVYGLVVVMCLLAGVSLGNSLGVAVLPCALSGAFFGGVFPLSRQMARHEASRAGRPSERRRDPLPRRRRGVVPAA